MIGQNGAGKSTVLKGIYNMAQERHGDVRLAGVSVFALSPQELLRKGLAYIPQQHTIFPKLSIGENLSMGGYLIKDRALLAERIAAVEAMFPVLAERRAQYAASLSGGEQRMLEIARTLVVDPKVMMLDEPSIGLAPRIVDQVFAMVRRLAESGKAILMVEQNVKKALAVADCIRSSPTGDLNLPARTRSFVDGLKSTYASCRTVVPPPKSGVMLKSKYLPTVPWTMGRTRRNRNVSVPTLTSSPG